LTAEYDVLRDEAARLYGEKLKSQGVEVIEKRYPQGLHGFITHHCLEAQQATELMKIFIEHVSNGISLNDLNI
jgi:acetyl esterase/lipase